MRWERKRSSFDGAARASVIVLCWAEVASPLLARPRAEETWTVLEEMGTSQPGRATLFDDGAHARRCPSAGSGWLM